jgi:hypothetical protein
MGARLLLLCGLFHLAACADNAGLTFAPDRIEPGVGAWVKGVELTLGAPLAPDVQGMLGTPEPLLDLGSAGVRVRFPDAGVAVTLTGAALMDVVRSLALTAGYAGKAGEIGLGAARADVEAAFGAPVVDPLLGAWLYPKQGLTFRFEEDVVAEILLEAAR